MAGVLGVLLAVLLSVGAWGWWRSRERGVVAGGPLLDLSGLYLYVGCFRCLQDLGVDAQVITSVWLHARLVARAAWSASES